MASLAQRASPAAPLREVAPPRLPDNPTAESVAEFKRQSRARDAFLIFSHRVSPRELQRQNSAVTCSRPIAIRYNVNV